MKKKEREIIEAERREYGISGEDLTSLPDNVMEYILFRESRSIEDKKARKEAEEMAAFDDLTGLQRRGSFERNVLDYIEHLRKDADKGYYSGMGFVFMDTRDFKRINDSLGDAGGDIVLKGIASQLKDKTRNYDEISRWDSDDYGGVSRWGGDEFALLTKAKSNLYKATASLPLRMGNMYIDNPEIPGGLNVELDMGATVMDNRMVAEILKSRTPKSILDEVFKRSSRASKISKYEAKKHEDRIFMCFWNPGYPTGEISSQISGATRTPAYITDFRDGGEEFILCRWGKI